MWLLEAEKGWERVKKIIHRLKWYIKIAFLFGKLSLQSQMEYSLNFISGVCVELAYMLIKLVYLYVVIDTGTKVGSLTSDMVILFVGTYIFMTGIWMMLSGVNNIPNAVIRGNLDLLMTKPGSLQFLQTFGKFNFAMAFPNVTVGLILIIVGWIRSGIQLNFTLVGTFLYYMLGGILLTYSFGLISSLLVFWVTSMHAVYNMYAALWDYNNMPMELYPKAIKRIGTFVIPIFLVTNWQGMAVLGKLSGLELVWGIVFPVAVFLFSRILWKKGMKRYISANG
ncbi:MAG: transporter permease [Herbinix sp.]|jgi:ABC-2 type transport system permease protein|nr:transporter permease [Herbinix sp.]